MRREMKTILQDLLLLAMVLLSSGCTTNAPKEVIHAEGSTTNRVVDVQDQMHCVTNTLLRSVGFDFEQVYKPLAPGSWEYLCALKGKRLWGLPMQDQWRACQYLEQVSRVVWAPFFITDFHPHGREAGLLVVVVEKRRGSELGGIGVLRFTMFCPDGTALVGYNDGDEVRTGWSNGLFISIITKIEVKSTPHRDVFVISVQGGGPCQISHDDEMRQYYGYEGDRYGCLRLLRIEDDKGEIIRNDYRLCSRVIGEIGRPDMGKDYPRLLNEDRLMVRLGGEDESEYCTRLTTLEWLYGESVHSNEVKRLVRLPNIASRIKELAQSKDKWMREAAQMVLKTYDHQDSCSPDVKVDVKQP